MNNYEKHAWIEFRAAGWTGENGKFNDEMQELICKHVLKLLEVFHGEGHSGSSAPYAINLFEKLAKFEPVAPLTGEDWEWYEVSSYSSPDLRGWKDEPRFLLCGQCRPSQSSCGADKKRKSSQSNL